MLIDCLNLAKYASDAIIHVVSDMQEDLEIITCFIKKWRVRKICCRTTNQENFILSVIKIFIIKSTTNFLIQK